MNEQVKTAVKKNCGRKRISCVCKENHPTGQLGYNPKNKEPVAGGSQNGEEKSTDSGKIACASTTNQEDISMCVVLVKVKRKYSNFVYSTFAMLDTVIAAKDVLSKEVLQKPYKSGVSRHP